MFYANAAFHAFYSHSNYNLLTCVLMKFEVKYASVALDRNIDVNYSFSFIDVVSVRS